MGLRILVMGRRYLDADTFHEWRDRYNDSRKKGRNLSKLYQEMESELHFLGVSAIEDKLQEMGKQIEPRLNEWGLE